MVSFVNETFEPKTKLSSKQLVFLLLLFSHSVVSDCFMTPWTVAPGSSVPGVLQARILEWVAISFSRGSSGPRD